MKISASQIATYRDCPRKWAWDKLDGIRSPPNASAQLGSAVHEQLERWLLKATEPDESRAGKIARRAIPHLPTPGSALGVEKKFVVAVDDDLEFIGTIDLVYERGDGVVIHDHKTTSNLGYRKKAEDLAHDPQAIIYAAFAMDEYGVQEVSTQWLYLETKADSTKVALSVREWTPDELQTALDKITDEAHVLVQLRKSGLKALDIEPDASACEKYGGCFYKPNCNLTTQEKIGSIVKIQSLQDKITNGVSLAPADVAPPMRGFAKIRAAMQAQEEPAPSATSRGTINAPEAPDPEIEIDDIATPPNADLESKLDAALAEPVRRGRGRPPKARFENNLDPVVLVGEPRVVERMEAVAPQEQPRRRATDWETQSLAELETRFAHRAAIAVRIDELRLMIKAAL